MDLDEEIPESSQLGQWHSVKTLDQFWELMAFRQECSAGRLVGFLWLVVNPPGVLNSQGIAARTVPTIESSAGLSEESQSQPRSTPTEQPTVSVTADAPPIASLETYGEESQEPVASAATTIETVFEQSVTPGVDSKTILLSYQDYGTATELLTQLDFADEELALASTTSMFGKLSDLFGESIQCETVAGRWKPKVEPAASPEPITSPSKMNVLGSGFIRKRKRAEPLQGTSSTPGSEKPSLNGSVATATDGNLAADTAAPNLLQVRKKNKPTS
jgi:regulator of Ty1 transposition protein 109